MKVASINNSLIHENALKILRSVRSDGQVEWGNDHALVDSEAGPSVIEIEIVFDLGFEVQLITKEGKIFGLPKEPVEVVSIQKLSLDLGNGQIVNHSFEVLTGAQNTCILGMDLLTKSGVAEFNWQATRCALVTCRKTRRSR